MAVFVFSIRRARNRVVNNIRNRTTSMEMIHTSGQEVTPQPNPPPQPPRDETNFSTRTIERTSLTEMFYTSGLTEPRRPSPQPRPRKLTPRPPSEIREPSIIASDLSDEDAIEFMTPSRSTVMTSSLQTEPLPTLTVRSEASDETLVKKKWNEESQPYSTPAARRLHHQISSAQNLMYRPRSQTPTSAVAHGSARCSTPSFHDIYTSTPLSDCSIQPQRRAITPVGGRIMQKEIHETVKEEKHVTFVNDAFRFSESDISDTAEASSSRISAPHVTVLKNQPDDTDASGAHALSLPDSSLNLIDLSNPPSLSTAHSFASSPGSQPPTLSIVSALQSPDVEQHSSEHDSDEEQAASKTLTPNVSGNQDDQAPAQIPVSCEAHKATESETTSQTTEADASETKNPHSRPLERDAYNLRPRGKEKQH